MGYKTKEWRNSMRVTLDYNNMTDTFLGERGFSQKQLSAYNLKAAAAFRFVKKTAAKTNYIWAGRSCPTTKTKS